MKSGFVPKVRELKTGAAYLKGEKARPLKEEVAKDPHCSRKCKI
jgi:hypothetical protein